MIKGRGLTPYLHAGNSPAATMDGHDDDFAAS